MAADIPENMSSEEKAQEQTSGQFAGKFGPSKSWLTEISAAKQWLEKFHRQGDEVVNRYLDKRESNEEKVSKYNLFTVNTQILLSTLYAKFPEPVVTREWEDQDDDVARVAAIMIERVLRVRKRDVMNESLKSAVLDRLTPGLGQVWFRYEPTIISVPMPPAMDPATGQPLPPEINPVTQQPIPPQMMEKLVYEDVVCDYIHWKDFLWSPCRVWTECRWVARVTKMVKEDVEKRFGPDIAKQLSYSKGCPTDSEGSSSASEDEKHFIVQYAWVYEIWCKRTRSIYWVSEGFDWVLDQKKDPFQLLNFWPCPKPLRALNATNSTIPRSDYLMIQDQYEALDRINNRISYLERAVKVVGIYDKTSKEIGRIFSEDKDNEMIGADNYAQFSEKGGMANMISWLPLDAIVMAIEKLRVYRQDLIGQIYELSGISDIMRGASKASETLGAQELKAQYGGVRLQMIQMDVAEFVEEALDIRANIMAKMFQPATFTARSNILMTPDAQLAEPATKLIKSQMSVFRIEVHADSMAVPEFNAERDARIAYLRMVSEFLVSMAPLTQQAPGAAPYLLKLLQWGAAGFRVGRTIEGTLDQAINAAEKALANPPPPPEPNPKDVAQAQNYKAQALKNTAEAIGQQIENAVHKEHPTALLPEPKPEDTSDAAPTTH